MESAYAKTLVAKEKCWSDELDVTYSKEKNINTGTIAVHTLWPQDKKNMSQRLHVCGVAFLSIEKLFVFFYLFWWFFFLSNISCC